MYDVIVIGAGPPGLRQRPIRLSTILELSSSRRT